MNAKTKKKCVQLIKTGNRIDAIKLYRDTMKCGLRESIDAVNDLKDQYISGEKIVPKAEKPNPSIERKARRQEQFQMTVDCNNWFDPAILDSVAISITTNGCQWTTLTVTAEESLKLAEALQAYHTTQRPQFRRMV